MSGGMEVLQNTNVCTGWGLQVLEAVAQAGRGREGALRPGDRLPLTSSWGRAAGCQGPGARAGRLMPGAPWARPGHGGDSTSLHLLSLC